MSRNGRIDSVPSEEDYPAKPRGQRAARVAGTERTVKQSLLAWRLSKQLSQREAAVILGLSQAAYARFELEKRYARGRQLVKKLRVITGLPLHVILGIDE